MAKYRREQGNTGLFFGNRGTKLYILEDENIVGKFIKRGTREHGAILEGNRDPFGRPTFYDRHYAFTIVLQELLASPTNHTVGSTI